MIYRQDLGGWWRILFRDDPPPDPPASWGGAAIHVPSCWNEVFPERSHYDGVAWYVRDFAVAAREDCCRWRLCFEGANYACDVTLNGHPVGRHEGGFTFFHFDVTDRIVPGSVNTLVVRVSGALGDRTIPPRGVDWFNYGGIYRPVYLEATGPARIDDYTITTRCDGSVVVGALVDGPAAAGVSVRILDALDRQVASGDAPLAAGPSGTRRAAVPLRVSDPRLWGPADPYLYRLELQVLLKNRTVSDRLTKPFGIREFAVRGRTLLVNGEEVRLVGCSKHEDYPLTGRVVSKEQLVKDYDLLRQMNANLVRLAHYPHNAVEHELLNEIGMVSIAELPLVFLHREHFASREMLELAKRTLTEMVLREKNETNIMFWSLFIECDTHLPESREFVRELVDHLRALDDSRLVIMASIRPLVDVTYDLFDVVGLNYWEGWYGNAPASQADEWIATMATRFPDKPILITSHGWEAIHGMRSYTQGLYWSEDLQSAYLARVADVFMGYLNVVGEVIWTFSDFRVSPWRDSAHETVDRYRYQERPGEMNHKGMVDYQRRPKSTYHVMQQKFAEWQEILHLPERLSETLSLHRCSSSQRAAVFAGFRIITEIERALRTAPTVSVVVDLGPAMIPVLETLVRNRMFLDWSRVLVLPAGDVWEDGDGWERLRKRARRWFPDARLPELPAECGEPRAFASAFGKLLDAASIDLACFALGPEGTLGAASRASGLSTLDTPMAAVPAVDVPPIVLRDLAVEEPSRSACVVSVTAAVMRRTRLFVCFAAGAKNAHALRAALSPASAGNDVSAVLTSHPSVEVFADCAALTLMPPGIDGRGRGGGPAVRSTAALPSRPLA